MASQSSGSDSSHELVDPKFHELITVAKQCTIALRATRLAITQYIKVITNEQIVAPRQCHAAISAVVDLKKPVQTLHVLLTEMTNLPTSVLPSRLSLVIDLKNMQHLLEDVRQLLEAFRMQLLQGAPQEERRLRPSLVQRLRHLQKQLRALHCTLKSVCEKFIDFSEGQDQETEGELSQATAPQCEEKQGQLVPENGSVKAVAQSNEVHFGGNEMAKTTSFTHGYALVIGVGKDLPITVEDAMAVKNVLIDTQRCSYPSDQIRLLTEQQATSTKILQELDWLAQKSQHDPQSTAIVYFSGHGGDFPAYHLVPYNYDPRRLNSTAVSGNVFTEKLRAIHANKLLVVLDCCHAGGMAAVKALSFRSSPMPPELATVLVQGSGRVVIASSRKDEVSLTGTPYSEFTQAFLEALAGYGAAEQDGYAYIADIALYVGRMVANRTKDQQHPILNMQGADNFIVAYYAGGEKSPRPLIGEPIPLFPLEMQDDDIVARYRRIYKQYQGNLLTIEEQMAQFIDQAAVPPDLLRAKTAAIVKLAEIEQQIEQQG
jgi:Caspase domain